MKSTKKKKRIEKLGVGYREEGRYGMNTRKIVVDLFMNIRQVSLAISRTYLHGTGKSICDVVTLR